MNEEGMLRQRIEKAAAMFVGEYLRVAPKSISIDLHSANVIVTLQCIVPPAEKDFAHGNAESRALLEKCYGEAFDAAKADFEQTLANIMNRHVESSMLRIHPESGNGVMIVNLAV